MNMKRGKDSKSGDIRSYFKSFASSGQVSRQADTTATTAAVPQKTTKRKAIISSDEEDNKVDLKPANSSSSTATSSKKDNSSQPKKRKEEPSSSKGSFSKSNDVKQKSTEKQKHIQSPKRERDKNKSRDRSSTSRSPEKIKKSKSHEAKTHEKNKSSKHVKLPKSRSGDKDVRERSKVVVTKRVAPNVDTAEEGAFVPPSKKKPKESSPEKTTARKQTPHKPDSNTPESTPEQKKRPGSSGYFKFLSRGRPQNLGAKEFPEGAAKCLEGRTFVLTGVLPSFERDDVVDVICQYGGRVTTGVSKKTSFVIIGSEAGESKIKKAQSLNVPQISEDDFLEMLRKSNPRATKNQHESLNSESIFEKSDCYTEEPGPSNSNKSISIFEKSGVSDVCAFKSILLTPTKRFEDFHDFDSDLETPPKVRAQRKSRNGPQPGSSPSKDVRKVLNVNKQASPTRQKSESPSKTVSRSSRKTESPSRKSDSPIKKQESPSRKSEKHKTGAASPKKPSSSTQPQPQPGSSRSISKATSTLPKTIIPSAQTGASSLMWVDKYKPTSLKNIVGQAGERSNAKKLLIWLENWFKYHGSADDKAKASFPGLRDPDGKTFKAALLSGLPGIGKTTTAHLCCRELNYDFIEMNASDQRNKKGLHSNLSDSLSNTTLKFAPQTNVAGIQRKHVIIMDEVDGMSGNEDRGGIQELIAFIKSSRIPIICICNDRNHQKIRSLANYCFDLRFTKPRNEQLKSFIQSVCFKEKIKVDPEKMQQLIISTDQDVRQILHQLQMFKESDSSSVYNPRKDLRLGPWDVVRKVFSSQEHAGMSINDKASLFFQDYSLGPLFVQENYLKSIPTAANGNPQKMLDLIKAAADSLAIGDCVDNLVRKNNAWSLLPVQAIFTSVLPGEYMEGTGMLGIDFPQWLGKNSNRNKRNRLIQEIHNHVHLQVSGSTDSLNMDYLPYLRRSIVNPLANGEIEEAAHRMSSYYLLRDDLESLNELALWPNMRDNLSKLDSKSKAAFTRMVNKEAFVPYSVVKVTKGRGKGANDVDDELEALGGEDDEEKVEEEEEDNEDLEKDAMIKVKKPKAKPAPKASSSGSSAKTSKKGGGRGKK